MPINDEFDVEFDYVGRRSNERKVLFITNDKAPKNRLIEVDALTPYSLKNKVTGLRSN